MKPPSGKIRTCVVGCDAMDFSTTLDDRSCLLDEVDEIDDLESERDFEERVNLILARGI
jgi:hypothetical protein